MAESSQPQRVIEVGRSILAPPAPPPRLIRSRKLGDYGGLPAAYRDVARKYSSPLLMGPPVCDELLALVQHLYTEEEAAVVRHLGLLRGRTAAQTARAEHRPVDQVLPILAPPGE